MFLQILDTVLAPLLQEAKESPNLLSDLAGLEKYIAESYSSRSFIELLQNADDAGSQRLLIKRVKQHIIVANDGRKFNAQDFESLCRSAASNKERDTSIGFRGIGFKSVVGFAKHIHIISGDLEATFCRELTSQLIPEAVSVPLIRIPHPIDCDLKALLQEEIEEILDDNYTTIFIFSDLIADFVESEFESLDPACLLFLRNVNQIVLEPSKITYTAARNLIDKMSVSVILSFADEKQSWLICSHFDICIALQKKGGKYIKIEPKSAVVHAFLPTAEETGFCFKVNGNISTDPSRLRVIFDESTINTIYKIAELYIKLLKQCFDSESQVSKENLIETLIPVFDPRIINFQKNSFQKQFMMAISQVAENAFTDFYRRPSWLNPVDAALLASYSKINIPHRDIGDVIGLDNLLKFFDIKEISIKSLSSSLTQNNLTIQGAVEVVSFITQNYSTKQFSLNIFDKRWKVWSVNNKIISLDEAIEKKLSLDISFTNMIIEKIGISSELYRLLNALTDEETAKTLFPPKENKPLIIVEVSEKKEDSIPIKNVSLVKWRSAEQQILEILNSDGWSARDVSRQNIGYDIEAINPKGQLLFFEVKSLQYEGQSFSLTSNEEATARDKGNSYILALVIQKNDQLHVMFIEDPLKVILLERQCKQWVWLCSSYNFSPKIYTFQS